MIFKSEKRKYVRDIDKMKKMKAHYKSKGKDNGMMDGLFQLKLGLSYSQQQRAEGAAASTSDHGNPSSLPESADMDLVLSQDIFCTPDYITPENQFPMNELNINKDRIQCPKSPEKSTAAKTKKLRSSFFAPTNPLSPTISDQQVMALSQDQEDEDTIMDNSACLPGYVSKSAVALRCRVMPPPCITNPFLGDESDAAFDSFSNWRSKFAGIIPPIVGGDGLSRYHTDFHEIQHIGTGNFSKVYKVLKRIDGCSYAVKQSTRVLQNDADRRKALMEVQALAALGFHENIVSYYSSWFENEQLYIQMELCDTSLSINEPPSHLIDGKILLILHQIAKALKHIHGKGIAHLDVKPDNIYLKDGVFKLGDFGCATLVNQTIPIEEGDARYMPLEILNDNYDNLHKVDIFSLGCSILELIRGARSCSKSNGVREGKIPLLPGYPLQFQNLLKAMVDVDPGKRPSAEDLVNHPIFHTFK